MPELPEVETVRRGLHPHVVGRTIARVVVRERRLRWPVDAGLGRRLRGRRIVDTGRRGKYLLLALDNGDRLLVHLGMTGNFLLLRQGHPLVKHDHVDLELSDGGLLRFHDPRRFGAMLLWRARDPEHVLLRDLGPEPLGDAFGGAYLHQKSRGRASAVKSFVMDGTIVVGAGNIYATEALFRAGIRPSRPAGKLTRAQCDALASAIREVLGEAVEKGGTTISDFAGADGAPGYFAQDLRVYDRAGAPCYACRTPIRRVVIGQRSSFYCPKCQR